MTDEDLEAVSQAVEHGNGVLVKRDRGVIIAVAVVVVAVIVAMSIPLVVLLRDRNDARSEAAQLRAESLCRSEVVARQDVAVAAVLDSFAVLLLSGSRGQSPKDIIPAVEAAQQQLAEASVARANTEATCHKPTN